MGSSETMPLEVDVQTVARWRHEGRDFLFLDVREQVEFETASIEDAVLLPMSEIARRVDELDEHRHRHIVVHCHHGVRSLQVVEALRSRGFEHAQSMAGGIDDWSLQVDSTVPRY